MRAPRRRLLAIAAAISALALGAGLASTALWPTEADSGPAGLAQSFADAGDHRRAAETLFAAYRASPTERGRIDVGRALMIAGENAWAIDLLSRPMSRAPEEFARRHLLAEALLRLKRHEDARAIALALVEDSPGDARARLLLARSSYELGDFGVARSTLGEALRTGGEALGDAWLFRARMALHACEFDAAASALARARAAGVSAPDARALEIEAQIRSGAAVSLEFGEFSAPQRDYLRVLLDAREGRFAEAARKLRDIEPWVNALPYGALLVARIRLLAGDTAQGLIGLDRALVNAPDNPLMLLAKAEQGLESGRPGETERITARLSADPDAMLLRLSAARRLKKWEPAVALAEQLAALAPVQTVDSFLFGPASAPAQQAVERFKPERAFADAVAEGLDASPLKMRAAGNYLSRPGADPAELIWAGRFLFGADDDAAAASAFQRALAAAPNCKECLAGALRPAMRAGAYDKIESDVRGLRSDDRAAALLIARALSAQGRFPDAVAAFAPALKDAAVAPSDAIFMASVLAIAGETDMLKEFARSFGRRNSNLPESAQVLALANLHEEAAGAARRALLAAPASSERAADYAAAMLRAGRQTEGAFFLGKLQNRVGSNPALLRAAAILNGDIEDSAGADIGSPAGLGAARADYLREPSNPRVLARYAAALEAAGEIGLQTRVRREACFWARSAGCES